MVQFSFNSDRYKYLFPEAVASVTSVTKSKIGGMMPPLSQPPAQGQANLYANFNVYASLDSKDAGGQPVDVISKTYLCNEFDEAFVKAEELFLDEVGGTFI
jgi:hypothetical protein